MNVLQGLDEQTYLYKNRQAICNAGTGADKVDWWVRHRPNLSAKLIAVQCYSGNNCTMDNPKFAAPVQRIELAKEKVKPKAKPAKKRGKPITRAGK